MKLLLNMEAEYSETESKQIIIVNPAPFWVDQ